MCGLVAVVGPEPLAEAVVEPALDALAHRGPDGRGVWCSPDGRIVLGHTRLAIVDRAGGVQPIHNEDGTVVAIVNGELYDEQPIARALRARGHRLRTRCDAELLVHLYEEHGDDVASIVRGELAFVLWDARRRRLLAGRDRFGIKPLVWARWRGGIALASEAKALFALGVPARFDDASFHAAAHAQYPWPDRTMFAGVHALEPGTTASWHDGELRGARYWDFATAGAARLAPADAPAALRAVLDDAVAVRLRADVPRCAQLSGGIDSTTIAALAARGGGLQACFTVGFDAGKADGYDERELARATAASLGLPLHEVVLDGATIAATWPEAVAHGEGLAINGHLVGKFLLSRAMREAGFAVAFTGEGADELLAGYAHLRHDAGAEIEGHAASRGVMLPDGDALSTASVRARLGYVPTWLAAKATLGHRVRSLLAPDLLARHAAADPYAALIDRLDPDRLCAVGRLRASAATWSRTALAGYILRTLGDGMEMRHGVEGRVPFLDPHVAELALSIPPEVLVAGPLDKPVLRAAVADLVPATILARPKHPFLAPPLVMLAPSLVQDTLRTHARRSALVDRARLIARLDALPTMTAAQQRAWDPALMLLLSAAILEARYCR